MKEIKPCVFQIEKEKDMLVDVNLIGNKIIIEDLKKSNAINQIKNVSKLNGIVKKAYIMPDGHEGYGFPIGGVAAFDLEEGIISPGGVGYDINCGVRLYSIPLTKKEFNLKKKELMNLLFKNIPCGVGENGNLFFNENELIQLCETGVKFAIEKGYGTKKDSIFCEEEGCMQNVDASKISKKAMNRGKNQIGTLGAGNHFLEIQEINEVFSQEMMKNFNIEKEHLTLMIHCGSRGFGHQICDDFLNILRKKMDSFNLNIKDKELACAPFFSKQGQEYYNSMKAAVNYAFVNRHVIGHFVRECFEKIYGENVSSNINLIYDVCHNIAKKEEHLIENKKKVLCVHRKGATRAFCKGKKEIPEKYRKFGQPVIVPGSMGTSSYLLYGLEESMNLAFGSSCHGAGRILSRKQAKNKFNSNEIIKQLNEKEILIKAKNNFIIKEEAPDAYKDVDLVIDSIEKANIAKKIIKLKPLLVLKG